MAVTCLNKKDQQYIIRYYEAGRTQEELAAIYDVSRRTIQRLLTDAGVIRIHNPKSAEEKRILQICQNHSITSDSLLALIAAKPRRSALLHV